MDDAKVKQVLLSLATEIEELRASLLAMSVHPSLKMSLADAQDAKTQAKKEFQGHYDGLRKEIESL